MEQQVTKGFKVTDADMKCREYQFILHNTHVQSGKLEVCGNGFHFCQQVQHCFNYYSFDPSNRVFEIEALGEVATEGDKSCCLQVKFIREIPWAEVLIIANMGKDNTGHSNSGNWNSGNWNSGDRNSGNRNSGNWNSGNWNSGDRNSGDSNSGYRNSGNWNSGDRNSGDSNSGYRNSGAFCTDPDPKAILFNKESSMTVRQWEEHPACQLMYSIDPTIWVQASIMTEEEKAAHPKWETTEGYLKTISMKEAWANFWHNLTDENKAHFTTLENFDPVVFEEITGVKVW